MSGNLSSRNVVIDGRRTSLRLEKEMWNALAEACDREGVTLHQMCTAIDKQCGRASRTSAVRAFLISYFRSAATEKGHAQAAHGSKAVKSDQPCKTLSHLFGQS